MLRHDLDKLILEMECENGVPQTANYEADASETDDELVAGDTVVFLVLEVPVGGNPGVAINVVKLPAENSCM